MSAARVSLFVVLVAGLAALAYWGGHALMAPPDDDFEIGESEDVPPDLEPGERLAALPARMIARRGHLPVPAGPELDVLDPVDQDPAYLPRAVDLITAALRPLVEQLT